MRSYLQPTPHFDRTKILSLLLRRSKLICITVGKDQTLMVPSYSHFCRNSYPKNSIVLQETAFLALRKQKAEWPPHLGSLPWKEVSMRHRYPLWHHEDLTLTGCWQKTLAEWILHYMGPYIFKRLFIQQKSLLFLKISIACAWTWAHFQRFGISEISGSTLWLNPDPKNIGHQLLNDTLKYLLYLNKAPQVCILESFIGQICAGL